MGYALSLGSQPTEWLEDKRVRDPDLARTVATWVKAALCADDVEIDSLPLYSDTGQRRYISRVPDTKVDITWLEAAPFRTMKVLWIEVDTG